MMEVVVTTGTIGRAKLQSNCHQQHTNTQLFTGRIPFLSPNQQCQSNSGSKTTQDKEINIHTHTYEEMMLFKDLKLMFKYQDDI